MTGPTRDLSSTPSPEALLPRICTGCQDVVPLAITASPSGFHLGWICPRCLVDDAEGLLDVVGVYVTREDAECDLLTEEYYISLGVAESDSDHLSDAVDPQ